MSQRAAERVSLTDRVQAEMRRRGITSSRAAAVGSGTSNETWNRFFRTGEVTPALRVAVARRFGWPNDWDDSPPPLESAEVPTSPTEVERLLAMVGDLRDRVEELEHQRDALAPVIGRNTEELARLWTRVAELGHDEPPSPGRASDSLEWMPGLAP